MIRSAAQLIFFSMLFFFAILFSGCEHGEMKTRLPLVDIDERAMNIWAGIRASDPIQIARDFDPRVDRAFPRSERASFLDSLRTKYGAPLDMSLPKRKKKYEGVYPLHFEKGELELRLALNERLAVIGITVAPPKTVVLARNKTPLQFPLEGTNLVLWGESDDSNPHADGEMQRYAYDILALDESGRARVGDGRKNTDYVCFGRKVYAPAAGTVVEAVDGVRDNVPGEPNPYASLGNVVMIQHTSSETSVLANLQRGSIRVHAGQKIARGQMIARCGNSGNSVEPRLRYHLQDQSIFQKGVGVKAYFAKLKRFGRVLLDNDVPERVTVALKGEPAVDFAPSRGDIVQGLRVADSFGRRGVSGAAVPAAGAAAGPGAAFGGSAGDSGAAAKPGRAIGK